MATAKVLLTRACHVKTIAESLVLGFRGRLDPFPALLVDLMAQLWLYDIRSFFALPQPLFMLLWNC